MKPQHYTHRSNKGVVTIRQNAETRGLWDLLIADVLVCAGRYRDPRQAAIDTSRRDFGDETLNKKFVGLRGVPDDLDRWEWSGCSQNRWS